MKFFTPGPSQLYPTAEMHLQNAIKENIGSLNHRSKAFEKIYAQCKENLEALLGLPSDYHVFFLSSATEIWERQAQNLIAEKSFHIVNGSFSKRCHEIALACGRNAEALQLNFGEGIDALNSIPDNTELIALTQNETSTGVSLPPELIHGLKEKFPQTLVSVDSVSGLPYANFNYLKLDSVYFSVQKGFGLPAGLGVWLVNEKCIARAEKNYSKTKKQSAHNSLLSLYSNEQKNQTPSTPNVLDIYLLMKVSEDMLQYGIEKIRKETEEKASMLYAATGGAAFVKDKKYQSQTVVVCEAKKHEALKNNFLENELNVGDGYGNFKGKHFRIANFPAHSIEDVAKICDILAAFSN